MMKQRKTCIDCGKRLDNTGICFCEPEEALTEVRKRILANVRRIHENWATEEDLQKLTDSRLAIYKSRIA